MIHRLIGFAVAVALAAGIAGCSSSPDRIDLGAAGGNVVIVDFWAVW